LFSAAHNVVLFNSLLSTLAHTTDDFSIHAEFKSLTIAPVHVAPVHVAPVHVEPVDVEPVHAEFKSLTIAPVNVEPVDVEPVNVEPIHAEFNINHSILSIHDSIFFNDLFLIATTTISYSIHGSISLSKTIFNFELSFASKLDEITLKSSNLFDFLYILNSLSVHSVESSGSLNFNSILFLDLTETDSRLKIFLLKSKDNSLEKELSFQFSSKEVTTK